MEHQNLHNWWEMSLKGHYRRHPSRAAASTTVPIMQVSASYHPNSYSIISTARKIKVRLYLSILICGQAEAAELPHSISTKECVCTYNKLTWFEFDLSAALWIVTQSLCHISGLARWDAIPGKRCGVRDEIMPITAGTLEIGMSHKIIWNKGRHWGFT